MVGTGTGGGFGTAVGAGVGFGVGAGVGLGFGVGGGVDRFMRPSAIASAPTSRKSAYAASDNTTTLCPFTLRASPGATTFRRCDGTICRARTPRRSASGRDI